MEQMLSKSDNDFQNKHPDWLWGQYPKDFADAVREPNGVPAMLNDMFHVNRVDWGFSYKDIANKNVNDSNIKVWYGGSDDTAPHGKWICGELGVEGHLVEDAGHGLIHSHFESILESILQA